MPTHEVVQLSTINVEEDAAIPRNPCPLSTIHYRLLLNLQRQEVATKLHPI